MERKIEMKNIDIFGDKNNFVGSDDILFNCL